ncbi:hypothetical protein BC1002_0126 [Paraburkholderia atlantica]|uniref:DUF3037 domain-containing protein n=1 Tax=Paraburkholderia atlantica TaxID=2654982 RepID=D5WA12_PARAM|nr:hypothetical protein [Paraburkholderia atlantica]ADG14234.1 hypothetical protein BC1002_0126 [Paraburkholderia atlantica]
MIHADFTLAIGDAEHLSRFASVTPKPAFSGSWTTVELQPDIFVPQRFTVGVVVQSPGDRLHFKLIDDFKKFECLYQDQFPQKSARELLAYAEQSLRQAVQSRTAIADVVFDTHCLALAPSQFTSGENRESTVERLFDEVVVMAPSTKRKVNEFQSIDTPHARRLVNAELKKIAQMDYERIVTADNQGILLDDKGAKHFLDLNLLTRRACGSVTSAVYKSPQSVEINLLKSSRDLTTYSRIRAMDNIGLFLLLPDPSIVDAKDFKRIEETIEEHEWKLERDGFRVVSMASAEDLAGEIYEWAKPTI